MSHEALLQLSNWWLKHIQYIYIYGGACQSLIIQELFLWTPNSNQSVELTEDHNGGLVAWDKNSDLWYCSGGGLLFSGEWAVLLFMRWLYSYMCMSRGYRGTCACHEGTYNYIKRANGRGFPWYPSSTDGGGCMWSWSHSTGSPQCFSSYQSAEVSAVHLSHSYVRNLLMPGYSYL